MKDSFLQHRGGFNGLRISGGKSPRSPGPADIANGVMFLSSEGTAGDITGRVLHVSGGAVMQ